MVARAQQHPNTVRQIQIIFSELPLTFMQMQHTFKALHHQDKSALLGYGNWDEKWEDGGINLLPLSTIKR